MCEKVLKKPLHVANAMCEAYDYSRPSAFSRGMEVSLPGARMVFVSGTASIGDEGQTLHAGDFRAQARKAFENARAVLQAARADWEDVVKATIFLTDIAADYEAFNEVRCYYFGELQLPFYPASTCIEAKLCRDDLLVEMELVAIVTEHGTRNTELGTRNSELGTRNSELGTRNTEHGTWNTELGTRNSELGFRVPGYEFRHRRCR